MCSSFVPPRHVKIGDAAAFVGTTARAIRHYHAVGLLPEPERGSDGRRRYGYDDIIRLLWIRRLAEAGVALGDVRSAFTEAGGGEAEGGPGVEGVLDRLDAELAAQEAVLQRKRRAVQLMRSRGSWTGLLPDVVAEHLVDLPQGALRPEELGDLLVVERLFGPVAATVRATRFIALATDPQLREESDRLDAAEEALDDTVAVDDPRVLQAAEERCAFEVALQSTVEGSGLARREQALLETYEAAHSVAAGGVERGTGCGAGGRRTSMSAVEASALLPHGFSPARLRCVELAEEMAVKATRHVVRPALGGHG